jgi:hypothetical protein
MIIGRASGSQFTAAQNSPQAVSKSAAQSMKLPEGCNRFLGTRNCEHLASSILGDLGGEVSPAALAMECFQKVAEA